MRLYELPDGSAIDLDKVTGVSKLHVCKHDEQYNNYEIYLSGTPSINIMENVLPRADFMALLG